MPEPRKNSLFQLPGIVLDRLEHVATVIRFDHDRRASAQTLRNQGRDLTKVHHGRHLDPGMRRRETKIVDRVVGHSERMKVDLADPEVLSGVNFYQAIL